MVVAKTIQKTTKDSGTRQTYVNIKLKYQNLYIQNKKDYAMQLYQQSRKNQGKKNS